ncbi:hypothetical protein [Variovorax sp. Sphag1AA]|uniref:hypothetical protein n=1 Tax=Variovorax sp. Sphag1AA TaxID=2587027 RepID=UPI001621ECE1|nr:hypothetical protein [Variovorax sp. Sphag1AA]MBB3175657.1 hypothetical protein [Variovorax sp. Sphag1AA]
MAHPTCAPARHPHVHPSGESPLPQANLAAQVITEIEALQDAYTAITCIDSLMRHLPRDREERRVGAADLNALISVVTTEFMRRSDAVMATTERMLPTPPPKPC